MVIRKFKMGNYPYIANCNKMLLCLVYYYHIRIKVHKKRNDALPVPGYKYMRI